jgi:hypothetical protein
LDSLLDAVRGSAASWHEGKVFIEYLVAICHDTLHVFAGIAVWLILSLVLRRSLSDWMPLLGTAAIAILNEAADLWFELWPSAGRQLGEGARDVLETIAIPALLFVALRLSPSLGKLRSRSAGAQRNK